MATTLSTANAGKPAPKWFRKFKKIWSNLENVALTLLIFKFPQDSFVFALVKVGSTAILENLETLLSDDDESQATQQ